MKVALEAQQGWVGCCPEEALEALAQIAVAEGANRVEFLADVAKAAGATRAVAHGSRRSSYRVLNEANAEASHLYEVAMSVAVAEIVELIKESLSDVDLDSFREQAGL